MQNNAATGLHFPVRFTSDTVVLGIGNSILSDDGIGVHALRLLEKHPRLPADLDLIDGGTIGLELLAYLSDASRILFLDAINTGGKPGTLSRMTSADVLSIKTGLSVHQLGVSDLISALALIAPKPQEIILLGLQPEKTGWGTTLSPTVEAALTRLVEASITQLQTWQAMPDLLDASSLGAKGQPPHKGLRKSPR